MGYKILQIKNSIRRVEIEGITIGGDSSVPFMSENENNTKPLFGLEVPYFFDNSYPQVIKNIYNSENFTEVFKKANETFADFISVKFNVSEENFENLIADLPSIVEEIYKISSKPIILRGANNTETDKKLLPVLAELAQKPSVIAFADEYNYEEIVPSIIKNNHILVLRSPIDINLAKELNILSADKGLSPDKILIDPDMGGLGYGLEYGYSIIEKIRQAGFDGDKMLNMPIIAFIGEESYKAKEAKSDTYDSNWGDYLERASMWEISAASAVLTAGANLIVVWNPTTIETIKEIL